MVLNDIIEQAAGRHSRASERGGKHYLFKFYSKIYLLKKPFFNNKKIPALLFDCMSFFTQKNKPFPFKKTAWVFFLIHFYFSLKFIIFLCCKYNKQIYVQLTIIKIDWNRNLPYFEFRRLPL